MTTSDLMLAHETTPLDIRQKANAILARARRIATGLGAPSLPPGARAAAKDELALLYRDVGVLWSEV